MQRFEFCSVATIEEVGAFLLEKGDRCAVIAGGTDLIPALRNEDLHPEFVLNLLDIESLRGVQETEDAVWIGATASFTEVAASEVVCRCFPLLARAASWVGGPQVRNRGTIGGNIANASPASDVLPAALALDAELHVYSKPFGEKRVPLAGAIEEPYKTRLRPDEFLTGFTFRKLDAGTRCAFEKLGRRNAMSRARMNLSLVLRQDPDGRVTDLRIVPGAVMPVARRMKKAEETLLGKKPDEELMEKASNRLVEEMTGVTGQRWSTEYKIPVMRNIFRRMFKALIE